MLRLLSGLTLLKLILFLNIQILYTVDSISPTDSHDELVQVIIITRHGDRTPTHAYPNSKSIWPEGFGQLTNIGMRQHYDLGQKFRKRYVDTNFINSSYNMNDVRVRSSPRERTLMSAQSFMLGFYPPGTGADTLPGSVQPVPIFSSLKQHDILLYAYKICPTLKVNKQELERSEDWINTKKKYSPLLRNLSAIFGGELALKDVTGIVNIIQAEAIHNQTSLDGVTPEMFTEMKVLTEWIYKHKFLTKKMGRIGAGNLVQELYHYMNNCTTSHDLGIHVSPKLIFLSAHDGTLLALMSALGLKNLHVPNYASHFVFELHYNKGQYTVTILYDDEVVTLEGCSEHCPIEQFHNVVKESFPVDWQKECYGSITSSSVVTLEPRSLVGNLLFVSVGFLLGIAAKTLFARQGVVKSHIKFPLNKS